jgi:Flp pilus assembly protein TadB
VIRVINPSYMDELFTNPIGWVMLATSAALLVAGTVVIRRMLRVRY